MFHFIPENDPGILEKGEKKMPPEEATSTQPNRGNSDTAARPRANGGFSEPVTENDPLNALGNQVAGEDDAAAAAPAGGGDGNDAPVAPAGGGGNDAPVAPVGGGGNDASAAPAGGGSNAAAAAPAAAPAAGGNNAAAAAPAAGGGANAAAPAAAPSTRFGVLKQKLVIEHKANKPDEHEIDQQEAAGIQHTRRVGVNNGLDNAAFGIGIGGTVLSAANALGPTVVQNAAEWAGDTRTAKAVEQSQDKGLDPNKLSDDAKLAQTITDVTGLVGGGLSAISGGLSLGANIYRATRDKNKYKREAAKRRAAAGGFVLGGGLSSMWSNAENLGWGGEKAHLQGSGAQQRGGLADIFTGICDIGEKISDHLGNVKEAEGHAAVVRDAGAIASGNRVSASIRLANSRGRLKNRNIPAGTTRQDYINAVKEARTVRHTAKAQKYAMAQATKFHKDMDTSGKGFINLFGGLSGGLGSIATGIMKMRGTLTDPTGGMISLALSGFGGILKTINGVVNAKKAISQRKKTGVKKKEIVDEYLNDKMVRIKADARGVKDTLLPSQIIALGRQGVNITDIEAKKIAVMRLGIEVPEDETEIGSKVYDKLFERLRRNGPKTSFFQRIRRKRRCLRHSVLMRTPL